MTHTIPKGRHRPRFWWLRFPLHFGARQRTWIVCFDESCEYYPNTYDHWNKLCGWSTSLIPKRVNGFWQLPHSIRVAWRPHPQIPGKVWLGAYLKEDGFRTSSGAIMDLGVYDYGENIAISIQHTGKKARLTVYVDHMSNADLQLPYSKPAGWGWFSGLYFGGKATAPHKMRVEITKQ